MIIPLLLQIYWRRVVVSSLCFFLEVPSVSSAITQSANQLAQSKVIREHNRISELAVKDKRKQEFQSSINKLTLKKKVSRTQLSVA